jgi:riboflavin transporter FmnP
MGVLSLNDVAFAMEPNVGFVIVRITRFASMIIVGFDPHATKVGDLAINIIHSWFFMKATIWIKIREGVDGKQWTII